MRFIWFRSCEMLGVWIGVLFVVFFNIGGSFEFELLVFLFFKIEDVNCDCKI